MTGTYYTFSANLAISTHTLTWSVTSDDEITSTNEYISTHTLTWSVTTDTRHPVGYL